MIAKAARLIPILLGIMIFTVSCSKQSKDLTLTTKSDEARKLFYEGLEKHDYFYFDEARAYFGQAVELDPDFAMAYYYWAICSQTTDAMQERLAKAADLAVNASEPERLIILSRKAMMDDSIGVAREMLEHLVELKPHSDRAHYLLGNFYYQQREWELAEQELKKAVELNPDFAPPYNMLGYLYANTERYPEAIEALKKYSELRPKEPNPHDSMGEIFLAMGDYDNSIKEYKKALRLESDFIYSLIGIGHNEVFMGNYDKAREVYDDVARRARNVEDTNYAYMWKTVSYLHQEDYDAALKSLKEQLEFAKAHTDIYTQGSIYYQMAAIYASMGQLEKALDYIAEVRRIASRPDIQAGIKENFLRENLSMEAIILTRLGRRDEANKRLAEYKKSAVASKNRVILMHFRGLEGIIAFWNKDYESAIERLSGADPLSPMFKYYLGESYLKQGNTEEARRIFSQLVGFNRNSFSYGLVRPKAMKIIAKIS